MFEQGDVGEALRHAIPLSSISDFPVLWMTFGLPGVGRNLRLNPFGGRPSSTMILGQSLYSRLQQLYRLTLKRVEAQCRIGEAAFELADLLRANEEAVAFMERHGKLREAAEIAEARELVPEIIIRQWFVAGEKERAMQVARLCLVEPQYYISGPEYGGFKTYGKCDVIWPLPLLRSYFAFHETSLRGQGSDSGRHRRRGLPNLGVRREHRSEYQPCRPQRPGFCIRCRCAPRTRDRQC